MKRLETLGISKAHNLLKTRRNQDSVSDEQTESEESCYERIYMSNTSHIILIDRERYSQDGWDRQQRPRSNKVRRK